MKILELVKDSFNAWELQDEAITRLITILYVLSNRLVKLYYLRLQGI